MSSLAIQEIPAQDLIRAQLAKRTPYRTPGVHISDLITDLVLRVPSLAKSIDSDQETLESMFFMGLVWEDVVGDYTGWKPVPLEREGILLSVDYLDPVNGRIDECKFTWKSLWKFDIRDQWRWMTQVKGYCYGWGVRKARVWCCHINGDYRPPSPRVIAYDLEFTDQELGENWEMLVRHAGLMERERERTGS